MRLTLRLLASSVHLSPLYLFSVHNTITGHTHYIHYRTLPDINCPTTCAQTTLFAKHLYSMMCILLTVIIMELEKKFYKVSEVADILGISRFTVVAWIRKGQIHAIQPVPNGMYLIPREEVERLLKERRDE